MTQTTLAEDLAKLRELKAAATQANKEAEAAKHKRDAWERHCLDRMEAEEQDSTKSRGYLYSVTRDKVYAKIQDREAFLDWARENAPHLLAEKEDKTAVTGLVRQLLDDNEELPPGLGFYSDDSISVRKAS